MDMDVVELAVSDPNLLQGVTTSTRSAEDMKGEQRKGLLGRAKERGALKEVTNILEVRTVNFKPNWTGLKSGKGGVLREAGPVRSWVQLSVKADPPGAVRSGDSGLRMNEGPAQSRPPDPNKTSEVPDPPALNAQISRSFGDGGDKARACTEMQTDVMELDAVGQGVAEESLQAS